MKEVKDSSKQLIKGTIIVMIGLVLGKLIGYIYTILVARIGSEIFGLYSLGVSIISFLIILSLFGLKSGIVRYVSYYKAKKDDSRIKGIILSSLKISVFLSIVFSIIILVFSEFISNHIFHNPSLNIVLKILAVSIPFIVGMEIFSGIFTAFKKIEYSVFITEIFEKLVKLVLLFILIYVGFKLEAVILSYLISIIISFTLSLYFLQKVYPLFRNKIKSIEIKKELIIYSFPLLFSGFLASIVRFIDIIMIGFFRSASEVGIYNVALSTSYLMVIIPTSIMSLFLPIITEKYGKKSYKDIKEISKKVARWILTLNLIIFVFIIAFSQEILKLVFGQEYILGNSSLIILSVGYLIFSFVHIHSSYLLMIKKTKITLLINIIMALLNVILNLYLIPKYGIIGGAVATSISLTVSYLLFFYFSYKDNKINPYEWNFLKPLTISILIFLVILATKNLYQITIMNMAIIGIISSIVYLLFLFYAKWFGKEDIGIIKLVIKKIKK